jgi:DNA-binding transcriptional ArsR family regulator
MKRVEVEAFREHPGEYLSGGEALAIEQEGTPIGMYIPVTQASETGSDPLVQVRRALSSALADTYRNGSNMEAAFAGEARVAEERREAVERLGQVIERILATSGMTEDELADALDLTKPFTLGDHVNAGAGRASGG